MHEAEEQGGKDRGAHRAVSLQRPEKEPPVKKLLQEAGAQHADEAEGRNRKGILQGNAKAKLEAEHRKKGQEKAGPGQRTAGKAEAVFFRKSVPADPQEEEKGQQQVEDSGSRQDARLFPQGFRQPGAGRKEKDPQEGEEELVLMIQFLHIYFGPGRRRRFGREKAEKKPVRFRTGFCQEALPRFGDFGVDGFEHPIHRHTVHSAGIRKGFRAGGGAAQAVHADGQQHFDRFRVLGDNFAHQRFAGDIRFSHKKVPPREFADSLPSLTAKDNRKKGEGNHRAPRIRASSSS